MSPKNSEWYLIENRRYPYIGLISVRKWPNNRLTDRQKNWNYFEIVEKYPRNVSINFRKISHPELEISLYQPNFSKRVSQQTDWQSYKKIWIIWNWCTNISGMSPKSFRNISHPELEISLYLCNCRKEVSQLTDWQTYKNFRIIWSLPANIPEMSQKKIWKVSHPDSEIFLYLSNFSKEVSQLTDWQTYKKFENIWN